MVRVQSPTEKMATQASKAISLGKIMVATDFSPVSDHALDYALSLARRYDARIYLTHIITPEAYQMMASEVAVPTPDKLRHAAENSIAQILSSGRMRGISHEVLVEEGVLWVALEALIVKHEIDLVVVGTHGMGAVKKLLLGSGAEQIFRQAGCPVLTVGPAAHGEAMPETGLKNILFATGFGPGTQQEAEHAISMAREHGAKLTLLHVAHRVEDYVERGSQMQKVAVTRQLQDLIPTGSELAYKPDFRIAFGDAVDQILQVARETRADLIVMGAKKRTGLAGHLVHTKAYRVVCGAPCPVLTVRS